ncbi:Gfo/Idh/MocA family protein [Sphingopyxis sp.]|jgi:scyllo-inositol 2-dehydrogenase (NAD+)|uniref:Gfo/Idh/MocA family protein n=1 Tax=Sphingopyxis sp. TaxID=1908224 RepID=UPI003F707A2C
MRRAAVIGCGRMGAFTSPAVREYAPACWFPLAHAEAVQAHGDLELAALCDPSAEGLARAQAHYGVARGYADHLSLLKAEELDLVTVATRTIGRAGIIADCFDVGVRALHIEKPLCSSVAELRRIEAMEAGGDLFLTYGTVRRFFPIYRHAVTLASGGDYGALREIRATLGQGALYWTHPHAVDLILMAAGGRRVEAVQARLAGVERAAGAMTIKTDPVIEAATIWFEDGVAGHIGRSPGMDLVLSCQSAELTVLNDGHGLAISDYSGANPYPDRQSVTVGFDPEAPAGTLAPIRELVACLDGDATARRSNAANRRAILTGQHILFAMVQSHLESARPVALDAVDPAIVIEARTGGNNA